MVVLRPVNTKGHIQGENIQFSYFFSLVMMMIFFALIDGFISENMSITFLLTN